MRTSRKTADSLALGILLGMDTPAERQAKLDAIRKNVIQEMGLECPKCECAAVEDNSCSGSRREFRCCGCDHRWGPGSEA